MKIVLPGVILNENMKFMYVLCLKPHRLGNFHISSTEIEGARYSLDGWRHRDIGESKPSTVITKVGKLSFGQISQRWIFSNLTMSFPKTFFFGAVWLWISGRERSKTALSLLSNTNYRLYFKINVTEFWKIFSSSNKNATVCVRQRLGKGVSEKFRLTERCM